MRYSYVVLFGLKIKNAFALFVKIKIFSNKLIVGMKPVCLQLKLFIKSYNSICGCHLFVPLWLK